MSREQRDRLAETYVAVIDALRRAVVPIYQATKIPDLPRPSYMPEAPPQSVGQYRAALAKLGKLGIAKVN